jgi:superfamily II DNA or RNA helicase
MNKRTLVLRDYQVPASKYVLESNKCVLAIAPGGGKTEITIDVVEKYMLENPTHKILILTHSTNVLLDNFVDRLKEINVSFTYSTDLADDVQVHLCLPSSEHKIKGHYDFIVIDEAHENYLAIRVQRIIEKVKPSKELLLTGTPSKFILKNKEHAFKNKKAKITNDKPLFDIYVIASNEISSEWFAKLNIELVASDYKWSGYYDSNNEVIKSFKFTYEDTKNTLEVVMEKLMDRIKYGLKPEQFNHPSFITKIKTWAFAYKTIGKTMIVCKRQEQAEMVNKILVEMGVNSAVSHADCDIDGSVIKEFKNNVYDVLVVVNRGKLGYNDVNLMNIIDVSGTHNPDVIYQMFSRVLRGGPETQKFYLKLTPKELHNMSLTHLSVCGALMLTDKNYLLLFDGKNFNNLEIPVIKGNRINVGRVSNDVKVSSNNKNQNILPEFTFDVIDLFKDILHNLGNPVSIYKMTTIGDVKETLGYANKINWTEDKIFASAMGISVEEYLDMKYEEQV